MTQILYMNIYVNPKTNRTHTGALRSTRDLVISAGEATQRLVDANGGIPKHKQFRLNSRIKITMKPGWGMTPFSGRIYRDGRNAKTSD